MNKRSPFRVILNLVLIVIVVISVVATGFVSIKEYRSNRIPEMYSDKQITKVVKEEYSDFEFNKDDNWNIETYFGEDNKSFTADVDIVCTKDLCNVHYGVQLNFKLVNGSWKIEGLPSAITLMKNEWLFENSEWSATAGDGTKYEVSFLTDLEAKLSIQESSNSTIVEDTSVNVLVGETVNEETVDEKGTIDESNNDESNTDENSTDEELDDGNSGDVDSNTKESNEMITCYLTEAEDGTFFEGIFEIAFNEFVLLVITEDSVKLMPSDEVGELILEKK